MAEGGLPSDSPSVGDSDGIEWEPDVKETMRKYKLTTATIDILGREGFTSFAIIDCLEIEEVISELKNHKINTAQRFTFKALMKARRRRLLELELEPNEGNDFQKILPNDHRKVLRQCKPELLNKLILLEVPNLLHADGVLTDAQYEQCNAAHPRYKRVEFLLGILEKGSHRSFMSFMRSLRSTKQQHLANYIEEYVSKEGKYLKYSTQ